MMRCGEHQDKIMSGKKEEERKRGWDGRKFFGIFLWSVDLDNLVLSRKERTPIA